MWYSSDNMPSSSSNTPRIETRPLKPPAESNSDVRMDLTKLDDDGRPFFVEDDRRSKITVISLKSNRTSRTVQTMPSVIEPPPKPQPPPKGAKGALLKAKKNVQEGFRESSIKRIIASGLVVATFLLFLFGVFLPFWNVYTYATLGVTTGYYGGLWNYCEVTNGETTCKMYSESSNAHWFRAVRFLELMAFMGVLSLLALVIAYMFCLREKKYLYLQWIIIGLCFGIAFFDFLGLVVFGASYSNSSHLSSAYGLTICGLFGCLASGALFLWDKIEMKMEEDDPNNLKFRGMSGARSSRPVRSRLSHVRSTRSHANSQRSRMTHGQRSQRSQRSMVPSTVAQSNIQSPKDGNDTKPQTTKPETETKVKAASGTGTGGEAKGKNQAPKKLFTPRKY